jgi:4-alpha-glucanotransferase
MTEYATALERLRRLAGVERGFTDYQGAFHELADEDLARLLAALGHATEDSAALHAEADALEAREWTHVLPPVVVGRVGRPVTVRPVMIAPMLPRIGWRIDSETGACFAGTVEPERCALEAERGIRGFWYQRRRLELPQLPAGYHRLTLSKEDGSEFAQTTLVVAPPRCHEPPFLQDGGRCWGVAVQLYSLSSERNWGIGDFTDLAGFAAAAAELGADLVGVNPLHALFPDDPGRCSPYSPSSREFLNILYIDPEAVPEFAGAEAVRRHVAASGFQARLAALRQTSLVDYAGVAACKLEVLRDLHAWFCDFAGEARRAAFAAFRAEGGKALADFAREEAERAGESGTRAEAFRCWLQWVAREQLDCAGRAAREAGMRIGLYLDLAVGPDGDSPEVRSGEGLFARAASVGAPPDPLAPQGQDWGIPPLHPVALREAAYQPFARLLRANMPEGGALRIDHVMMLLRLWWIPRGSASSQGAYVHYRLDELMAVLALESRRRRCLVIGEALGTVPPEVRTAMEANGVFSYRVLLFERAQDGSFHAPWHYPARCLVTPVTHDLPPLAGFWRGDDLAVRLALGLYPGDTVPEDARSAREHTREALLDALEAEALVERASSAADSLLTEKAVLEAVPRFLAGSPAAILMLQPEEWLGETASVNVPGTHASYPNWRRKLAVDWQEFMRSDAVRTQAEEVNALRRRAAVPRTKLSS